MIVDVDINGGVNMVSKSNFAPLEWKIVMQSPLLAGFAVSAADPSSFIGTIQEGLAAAKMLTKAETGVGGDLIKLIANELLTPNGRADAREGIRTIAQGANNEELKNRALEELKEAVNIVAQKTPLEAESFKNWLYETANTVAEAGVEGGFLGFGGVKVSDAERVTLNEISQILSS